LKKNTSLEREPQSIATFDNARKRGIRREYGSFASSIVQPKKKPSEKKL
jgi:hypothetical protein